MSATPGDRRKDFNILHFPDGSHRTTAPDGNGRVLERFEMLCVLHKRYHEAAGTAYAWPRSIASVTLVLDATNKVRDGDYSMESISVLLFGTQVVGPMLARGGIGNAVVVDVAAGNTAWNPNSVKEENSFVGPAKLRYYIKEDGYIDVQQLDN
jgi:hypothetical protein